MRGEGYEIHMGLTEPVKTAPDTGSALFKVNARNREKCSDYDGCITDDKKIAGTYMHGLFDSNEIRSAWLKLVGIQNRTFDTFDTFMDKKDSTNSISCNKDRGYASCKDRDYALLKEHFEKYIDFNRIVKTTGIIL